MAASLTITMPQAGEQHFVTLFPGQKFMFAFSLAGVRFVIRGDDLVLVLPDGGTIVLQGAAGDADIRDETPSLVLGDGTMLPFADLISQLEMNPDALVMLEGQQHGVATSLSTIDGLEKTDDLKEVSDQDTLPAQTAADTGSETEQANSNTGQSEQGQGGLSSGGNGAMTSGEGEFRHNAGSLIGGVWVMPDKGTDSWRDVRNNANREQGALPTVPAGTPDPGFTVSLTAGSATESDGYITFTVALDAGPRFGALALALRGGSATPGVDYDPVMEVFNGSAWVPATVDGNGNFQLSVSPGVNNIIVRFPLYDDHLSEGNESIHLELAGLELGGVPVTNFSMDASLSADAVIIEDYQPSSGVPGISGEKDGPLVNIRLTSTPPTLGSFPPSMQLENDINPKHLFTLELKDCLNPSNNYMNPDSATPDELVQDITVVLQLKGTADHSGTDWDYAFKPSTAMQALIDAGKMSYTLTPDGLVTIVLNGQHTASGATRTDGAPLFDLGELGDLVFEAHIRNDGRNEPIETVILEILSVSGNEAQFGDKTAAGHIADNASSAAGVDISWFNEPGTVAESGAVDPADAPANNSQWHTLQISPAGAADIRVEITLAGKNGAVLDDGSNSDIADFAWADSVQYYDGSNWHTLSEGVDYSYDPATGQCMLTIPAGASQVRFGVTVIDDLRELSDNVNESYDLTLNLVAENGLTDCAAKIGGSAISNTIITPDARSGALNPANFDGPYVVFNPTLAISDSDSAGNIREGGTVTYTLELRDPAAPVSTSAASAALYTANTESVTATLKVSFEPGNSGFQPHDLMFYNASGQVVSIVSQADLDGYSGTLFIKTGSGDFSQITVGGSGGEFTFAQSIPADGSGSVSFTLEINDDRYGGRDYTTTPADGTLSHDKPLENVTISLVGLEGNEARALPGDVNAPAVSIRDDGTAASHDGGAQDGPFVSVSAVTDSLPVNGEGKHYVPESGGSELPYKISLLNPSGGAFTAEESITVNLTVSGGDGFSMQDIYTPNASGAYSGTITYTVHYADGRPATTGTASISGNGTDGSVDFSVTLPEGATHVTVNLPVHDDPLGGSASSLLDKPEESVTLTVNSAVGNEARVPGVSDPGNGTASLIIKDDVKDNPAVTTDDAGLEGVRVGLAWKAGTTDNGTIEEGKTGVIEIKLFDAAGAALTTANNPYKPYTQADTLPEDLVITLRFADTADGGDMALRLSSHFIQLIAEGKATVTLGGIEYSGSSGANALKSLDLGGDFTVTLKGGSFDFASDPGKLSFNAHAFGDNVNEYDKNVDYASEHAAAQEQFGLTVTSVEGNESVIKAGNSSLTGTISDAADGKLTLSGGALTAKTDTADGYWSYEIAVSYPTVNDNANIPGGSVFAPGGITGAAKTLPGEDITLQLRVTDGSIMQHGEEYEATAYDIFLSLNGLSEGGTGVPSRSAYNSDSFTPRNNWILVEQVEAWALDGSGKDSAVFELSIPREYWDTHSDGKISFDLPQGDHIGGTTSSGQGGFSVALETPGATGGGLPEWDYGGEITSVVNEASTQHAVEDRNVQIKLSLSATREIYENDNPLTNDIFENVAVYRMQFTQERGGTAIPGDLKLACDISFDFILYDGAAKFNDSFDSNNLYDNMGDYAISDAEGNLYSYDSTQTLQDALQNILNDTYHGNVTVSVSHDGSNYKFTFTAKEGVDLSNGIDIYFVAMDDNLTESGESFSAKISNVTSENGAVAVSITNNEGKTTIYDEPETGQLSGFALAIGDGYGYEKLVGANLLDGKGIPMDGKVHVPVYAYILSNGEIGGVTTDGTVLTLQNLIAVYNDQKAPGDPAATTGNAKSNTAFQDFVAEHFKPSQDITIKMELTGGSAKKNEDFKDQDTEIIEGQPAGNWVLVIDDYGNIFFKNEFTVDSLNDYSEMPANAQGERQIDFDIKLTESHNNESRIITDEEAALPGRHGTGSTGHIKDFHDGPAIIELKPVGDYAYEPIDTNHGGDHEAAPKATAYNVQLDRATEEPMVVWLEITDNGLPDGTGAQFGEDYFLGKGIYRLVKVGSDYFYEEWDGTSEDGRTVPKPLQTLIDDDILPEGFTPSAGMDGNYFIVIPKNESGYSFDVMVRDDNKTESDERIFFEVVSVQGGEATYVAEATDGTEFFVPWDADAPYIFRTNTGRDVLVDPGKKTYYELTDDGFGNLVPGQAQTWTNGTEPSWLPTPDSQSSLEIKDDGFGPWVRLENCNWSDTTAQTPSFTITLDDVCQEDVTVMVRIKFIAGQTAEKNLTFTIPKGDSSYTPDEAAIRKAWIDAGGDPAHLADRRSFDIQITSSNKGESQAHTNTVRVFLEPPGDDTIWIGNLQSVDVTEGALPYVSGSDSKELGSPCSLQVEMWWDGAPSLSGGAGFSISLNPSSKLGPDTAATYKVSFTAAELAQIDALGNSHVTITITPDTSGNPVLVVTPKDGGPPLNIGSVTPEGGTKMPAAKGDNEIGDYDEVWMSVTDPQGGAQIHPTAPSQRPISIQDGTKAQLLLFMYDGTEWILISTNNILPEDSGAMNIKAVLVLADDNGPVIMNGDDTKLSNYTQVSTERPLEFEVVYGKHVTDGADFGADYIGSTKVRIDAGGSEGEFSFSITQDNFSEGTPGIGEEGFNIHLKPTAETAANASRELGQITNKDAGGTYGGTDVYIKDDDSGPVIAWSVDASEVTEGGVIVISWESLLDGGRQVVVEPVKMVFKITPDIGFELSEIESITFNGVPCTVTGPNLPDGPWYLTLPEGLTANTGLGSLTIQLKNDAISEGKETFTIELESVYGGETTLADPGQSVTVDVLNTNDGPTVDLVGTSGNEEDGTVIYTLKLSGDQDTLPSGEAATITLELNAEAQACLDLNGSNSITVTFPSRLGGGTIDVTANYDGNGKLIITLPSGCTKGDDFIITFPVKDDALTQTRDFGMAMTGVDGGEMTPVASISYSTTFVSESTAAPGGTDGGSFQYKISTGANLDNCHASLSFEVAGIVDPDLVKELTLGAETLVRGVDWDWDGSRIVVTTQKGAMGGSYDFKLVFVPVTGANSADITASKQNIGVSNAGMTGREVVVTIENESTAALKDGPSASLDLSAVPGMEATEGVAFSGNLVVDMSACANSGTTTVEKLTVKLEVSDNTLFTLDSAALSAGYTLTKSANGTTVTITIPAGSAIPGGASGSFEIGFTVSVPDNSLTNNDDYTLRITGIAGDSAADNHYEKHTHDGALKTVTVEDNTSDDSGPSARLDLGSVSSVTEGDAFAGTLIVDMADCKGCGPTTVETLSITLVVADNSVFALDAAAQSAGYGLIRDPDGTTITITIPGGRAIPGGANGAFEIGFVVSVPDNSLTDNGSYDLKIIGMAGDSGASNHYELHGHTGSTASVAITDNATDTGPRASLEIETITEITEGSFFTGTITVDMADCLGDGTTTVEALTVTLETADNTFLELDAAARSAGYILARDSNGTTITITIPAGATIPGGANGAFEIGFIVSVPDNSLTVNADYTLALTDLSGDGATNHYEVHDNSGDTFTVRVNDNASGSGPEARLALGANPEITEGIPFAGAVVVDMSGCGGCGLTTVEALTVTLEVADNTIFEFDAAARSAGYLLALDANGTTVTIIIPAGTIIPGGPTGAFEIGFTVSIPDDSLTGSGSYTFELAGLAGDSGAANRYEGLSHTGGSVVVDVVDDIPGTGPAASLDLGAVTDVTEGASFAGKVIVSMAECKGCGTETVETLTVTLEVADNTAFDLDTAAKDAGYSLTRDPNGTTITITIAEGVTIPGGADGAFDIGFIVSVPDNSLTNNGSYTLEITGMAGDSGAGSQYELHDHVAGPVSVAINDNAPYTGPHAHLEMTSATVNEGGQVAGTLVVQMPDLPANGTVLLEALTVTITLDHTDAFALTTPTIDGRPLALDDSGLSSSPPSVAITIPAGVAIPPGGQFAIGFTADVPDNSLSAPNANYTLAVTGLAGSSTAYEIYDKDTAPVAIPVTDDSSNPSGPQARLEVSDTTVAEGSAFNGTLVLQLPDLPANGGVLGEVLTITIDVADASLFMLDAAALAAGCSAAPQGTTQVVITVPADTPLSYAAPSPGIVEIGFTVNIPNNSLSGPNPDYTLKVTNMQGSGRFEQYTTPDASDPPVRLAVTNGPLTGPAADLTINEASVTEGESLSGIVSVQMPADIAAGQELGEALQITLAMSATDSFTLMTADIDGLPLVLTTDLSGTPPTATITIPAGVTVPAGGTLEIHFEAAVPDNCLVNGPGDVYALEITEISGSTDRYEAYFPNAGAPATPVVIPVTDNATLSGPVVSLVGNAEALENNAYVFSLEITNPLQGGPELLAEDLQITLRLMDNFDTATRLEIGGSTYYLSGTGNDEIVFTIPQGTDISAGIPASLTTHTSSGGTFGISIISIDGLGGGEGGTYETLKSGGTDLAVDVVTTLSGFSFSMNPDMGGELLFLPDNVETWAALSGFTPVNASNSPIPEAHFPVCADLDMTAQALPVSSAESALLLFPLSADILDPDDGQNLSVLLQSLGGNELSNEMPGEQPSVSDTGPLAFPEPCLALGIEEEALTLLNIILHS